MGVIQTEEKSLCRQYYDKQASEASFGNKCVCLTITDAASSWKYIVSTETAWF
jgi:hypothetical protein